MRYSYLSTERLNDLTVNAGRISNEYVFSFLAFLAAHVG